MVYSVGLRPPQVPLPPAAVEAAESESQRLFPAMAGGMGATSASRTQASARNAGTFRGADDMSYEQLRTIISKISRAYKLYGLVQSAVQTEDDLCMILFLCRNVFSSPP